MTKLEIKIKNKLNILNELKSEYKKKCDEFDGDFVQFRCNVSMLEMLNSQIRILNEILEK